MAEICHLENRHYAIFSVEGGQIWIKCRRLVQNDMSTTVMWSKSKPGVEFQYDGRLGEFNGMSLQSHVSHCKVLPRGKFTVMIPEPHATLQGLHPAMWHVALLLTAYPFLDPGLNEKIFTDTAGSAMMDTPGKN